MRKIRLQMEALDVESFEPAEVPQMAVRGTIRGAEQQDTIFRDCQTEQYDCTAQGGYTCDYGSCISAHYCTASDC